MAEKNGKKSKTAINKGGGGAVYCLGLLGALVFYWQQAETFGAYVVAILKAIVWPAFLAYDLLKFLHG